MLGTGAEAATDSARSALSAGRSRLDRRSGAGSWPKVEGFKIGIVWQDSRRDIADRWRSIPLAEFAPLARLPGVRLISLQKGFGTEQIATVDFPVLDLSARLDEAAGPFMDTAAVIGNLDLVVTADTAIAHLAGALGAPVWLALQSRPTIGGGSAVAKTPPGIPPCASSAKKPSASGPTCSSDITRAVAERIGSQDHPS